MLVMVIMMGMVVAMGTWVVMEIGRAVGRAGGLVRAVVVVVVKISMDAVAGI